MPPGLSQTATAQCAIMVEQGIEFWLELADAGIDDAPQDVREFYCTLAEKKNAELQAQGASVSRYPFAVCAALYHSEVLRGKADQNEALRKLFDYYRAYLAEKQAAAPDEIESLDTRRVFYGVSGDLELLQFMRGIARTLERWARRSTDKALSRRVMDRLIADVPPVLRFFTNTPLETSQQLTELCFSFLPWLEGAKAKEHWILELVTKKQFATHLHSVMVQKLAVALAESLYDARPELFDRVKARIGERDLMEFISKCALFHDVGKNDIATIVNMQARALDDAEFQAIRRHPYFGYHRFLEDEDFSCYRDVILFHHKTYDGKGGYPAEADKAASPYGIIVDLITICDCFDAATDTLGRNYKRAKTAEELVEELAKGAETVYDPDIVAYIRENPALQKKLKRIILDERLDTAYDIASQY